MGIFIQLCYCYRCGIKGEALHYQTWTDHQKAEKRRASHDRYSSDVLGIQVSTSTAMNMENPPCDAPDPLEGLSHMSSGSATGIMEMEPNLLEDQSHLPTTFPPQPDPRGPEPDVLLAPPLPGFDCDHADAIFPLIDDALPSREGSDNGSQILSDDESLSSVNPLHPQSDNPSLCQSPSRDGAWR